MLLRASEESENRTLTIVGAAAVLGVVLVVLLVLSNPLGGGRPADRLAVAINTPYVGQGVAKGTTVVVHGAKVGEVTQVASLPDGGVRLNVDLQRQAVTGLTNTMTMDFRPINYFGVTGVNLIAGIGGEALHNGSEISVAPGGNFTLQALLSRLGEVSTGVLTRQLVSVIDRATRYTDALDPFIETMMIAATTVADVQRVSTERLLRNSAGISVAFPTFVDALTQAGDHFIAGGLDDSLSEKDWQRNVVTLEESKGSLFAAFGKIEASHVSDLLPLINSIKTLSDVVPPLARPDDLANTLVELRTRFEKLYAGGPNQRALDVHIVLDSLPGVAAPLGMGGGGQ